MEHSMLNLLGNVTIRDCFAPYAGGGIASSYKFWGSFRNESSWWRRHQCMGRSN